MTGFQFKIWDVIVGGTFVPIVKWNKEAWGWNIRQLSMLTARSQQGVNPAIPHLPLLFYSGPQKLQKTPQTIDVVEPHPLGNSVCEAAPSVRRQSSLGLTFVVNMMRCCGHQPQATGSNSTVPSISTGQPTVQVATTLTSEKTSKTSMNNHILFLE